MQGMVTAVASRLMLERDGSLGALLAMRLTCNVINSRQKMAAGISSKGRTQTRSAVRPKATGVRHPAPARSLEVSVSSRHNSRLIAINRALERLVVHGIIHCS